MGLKDSIKRIFGSQDKKKKSKETVSKEPEPDYDDNCELCRANREGRPDHHTGHSSPDLTGKGIGPTKKPQERAVEANGSKDATNLGGQPQESFGRVPKDVSKPDDTKLRDTKEDKSTNKDQDTISKEPGDIQALDRRAGMDEARSPDLDRTTGDDLEHEKGFVGVGRTPGPSTTLMSDTKNAEDLNPFDNVPGTHGPHKPEAAKDTHGETSGEEVPKQFWDPGVSPKSPARAKNHNPFRTQGLSAQSEGLKADNGVPASTAGAALFGVGAGAAGAGAYAAREGNHGKGSSGIIAPTGVPGALHPDSARSPSTRRTPSPLDRSGDRFAPPSPPLSEHDRSIELGMRDEIDSQRFDPSRETTPLGHKEDHKNEDHHREEEFAVGGAGVGAGILGAGALAASRDKEDKDGKDEGKGREGREGKRLGPDEPVGPRARGGVPVSKDTTRDAETGVPDTRVFGTTGAGSAQRQAENGSGLGKSQENTDKPSDMRAQPGLGTGIAAGTALGGVAGATVAMNRQGTGHEDTGRDLNGGTNTTKNVTDARVSQPSNAMVEDVLTEDDTMGEDSMKPTSESARTGAGSGDDSGLSPYVSSQVGRGKNEGSVLPTEREEGSSLGIQQAQGEPSAMSANTSHQHHALAAGVAGATGAGVAATALGHERRGQGDNATAQPGSGSPPVSAMGTQRASRNAFMSGDTRDIHKSKTGEQFRVPDQFDEHGPSLVPISERPMESAPPAEDIAEEDDHGMIACHHALATQRASAEPARDLRQGVGAATTRSAPGPPPVRAMGAQRAIRNASKAGDTGAFHESPLKPREIPDQFDEHGSCLVLPSEKSMESSASDEDIAEEDDHGMIACHHALATQRAFTQPSRDSHATSGLAAAGAGAAGAAIAAPTHFAKSPTDTTSKASSGRPRLHTIPGTRAPITEETSELPKAKAPQRRTTIPGTGALISDDDEELKDVMAPSSTGGLLVPTAAVAEQSILGEQTSRVAGVGNEPNTMDLSGITELDDSGAERSLSTLDEEPDAPHLGHPSGIESAALAGGAFVTAGGYGLHHAQGSSLRSPEMGQTKQQSHETNPPSNAQSAHLSDQISGTPSDEEAWTKLPSEPKQEESTVDSESQYSVDSQQATFSGDRKEHNTRKADTSLTEGIGLTAGGVLGSIAGHLPAMPTIPGTSWGGTEDVSQESRSIAEPSISARSGNAPSEDINPSRSEPSLTQSGDSFRDSRHSEAMPGDWNMETTEEALGDSDAVVPPAEKPVPSTRKESPEIRIDPLCQKSSDTAPERLSPSQGGASSPKAGSPDAVTQELERQQAGPRPPRLSFDSFEAALTRNERENLSLTPRAPREATLAQQGIGSTQSQATRRTGHNGEGETGGTRAETRAGTAGLNLNGSGKSSAPRPEPSGVATIEEPYIYRRPGSLIGRPEVGIHNGVDSGPNTLPDSGKHEVGLTEEASDYETEEEQEEEPLLFRRDVAENQHVFTSVPHADPVFDKEVVDHQEHYSDNIATHDLTQDLAHTGQV